MSKGVVWNIGDPCPNCGREMRKIPRPPADRVRASKDPMTGVPIPQTFDTADEDTYEQHGDLYRCDPCWSQVRVKAPAAPSGAGTGA